MKPGQELLVRELLTAARVASVALAVDGGPHVGLLPFVFDPASASLVVHASRLAKHTRGLVAGAPFSALIHAPDRPQADPLQLPRLTLTGTVRPIGRADPAYREASDLYQERFPSSRITFGLGDFSLYALETAGARLVSGFAATANLTPGALRAAAAPPSGS